MKKLRTLPGQPLRSEFTALESAVLIHAANYCVKDETFMGVPTSNEERYRKNQTEYKVTEFTEDDITVTIMTGKNAGKELHAVIYSSGKTDNNNNSNKNSNNTKKQTEMETTTTTNNTNKNTNGGALDLLNGLIQQYYDNGYKKAVEDKNEVIENLQKQIESFKNAPKSGNVINITVAGKTTTTENEETYHQKFEEILNYVCNNENVYLYGPAGTGKNVICKQVANALKAAYFYNNTLYTKYDCIGYMDATGNFVKTVLYDFLKSEGAALMFFDELDNSMAEAVIPLNDLLADGKLTFANGETLYLTEDKHIIAAGNTDGRGATDEYNGRYKMDESTRSRFLFINVNYCRKVEESIVKDSKYILDFIDELRKACKQTGIKIILGYREIIRLKKYENNKPEGVLQAAILKGLTVDCINELKNNMTWIDDNKYLSAFMGM